LKEIVARERIILRFVRGSRLLIGETRFLQRKMQFRRGSPLPGGGRKAGLGEEAVGIPEMAKRDVAERIVDEVVGLRAGNTHSSREAKAQ
jgi:hypothetical protein